MLLFKETAKKKYPVAEPLNDYDSSFFTQGLSINPSNSVDKSLLLLIQKIGPPYSSFELSAKEMRYIEDNYHTKNGLQFLILKIFQHINIPFFNVDVTVENSSIRKDFIVDKSGNIAKYTPKNGIAGQYPSFHEKPHITINIEDYYPLSTIIAIACHECMHHFLRYKHIEFTDTTQNEILTDVAAIYMGFGVYLKKGYAPITIQVDVNKEKTVTVGYIKERDIKKLCNQKKAIFKNYQNLQKRKQYISKLVEDATAKITLFKEIYNRYSSCLSIIIQKSNANMTPDDFSHFQEWLLYADDDCRMEAQLQHEIQRIQCQKDARKFSESIDKKCTDLTRRIVILSKYL